MMRVLQDIGNSNATADPACAEPAQITGGDTIKVDGVTYRLDAPELHQSAPTAFPQAQWLRGNFLT
jgi:hypothetical protein